MKLTTQDNQSKTDWFIELSKQLGHPVKLIKDAPNGGSVIYFDGFQTGMADYGSDFRYPYWMLWTGDGEEYEWHVEFGHWYTPKNMKERRQHPTTWYVKDKDIHKTMVEYSALAKKENALLEPA